MSEFLARYSLREKLIVLAAMVVVIVIGAHALVIEPYQQRVASLLDEIEQQRTDLTWMKSAVARMPTGVASSSTTRISGTLANFIDQAVRRQGLSEQLSQMSPIGADEIRMRYKAVDFNHLIGFIAEVNSNGLEVQDMRILVSDMPGVVDSHIVLMRP
ncbi:MAG: type II secretion system protein M [Gammaproteobacteria bacterium]|nr:type II secretion system protein M [Gammaproteobacteria bacterium]